jgi:signal transduction histidine kinase
LDHRLEAWNGIQATPSNPATLNSGEAQGSGATAQSGGNLKSAPPPLEWKRDDLQPTVENVRPTLVVVDDEADVLLSVRNLLRMDYHVVTFQKGSDALEYLRSTPRVHVILSDQKMPGMSGVDVLRQAFAIRPETTRLLFTAYADIHTVVDAINQGNVFRYLAKPFEPDFLSAVIRQAVEHHNLVVEKIRLVAELQETNARLVEANRLKGAFIEVASHELNTPLSVVLGMIELWKMWQSPSASPIERQWVDRIGAAAGRLALTVERMLKLVRNRDFSQSLEIELVELGPIVHRVVEDLSPYLEMRRQAVTVDIDSSVYPLEADPSKIADVLINLLVNAIKFTPDGGTIRVIGRTEPTSPDRIRVQVSDQGAGVDPAEQHHLFEPFFTGFDTLRHSSGDYQFGKRGIGLGLCLVKTFVQLHGGHVEVSSAPGVGSTFSFILPRSQSERVGRD